MTGEKVNLEQTGLFFITLGKGMVAILIALFIIMARTFIQIVGPPKIKFSAYIFYCLKVSLNIFRKSQIVSALNIDTKGG
jgi:hypothetical protein